MAQFGKDSDLSMSAEFNDEGIMHENSISTDQPLTEVVDQGDQVGVATERLDKGKQRASEVNRNPWTDTQESADRQLAENLQAEEDDSQQPQPGPSGFGSSRDLSPPRCASSSKSRIPPEIQARYHAGLLRGGLSEARAKGIPYEEALRRYRQLRRLQVFEEPQSTPPVDIAPVNKKHKGPCIVSTPGDTIGQLFGKIHRLKVQLIMRPGSHDSPQFDLSMSQNLEGDWSTPYDQSLSHEVSFKYTASGQNSRGRYCIEDFKCGVYGDAGSPSFPEGAILPTEDNLKKLYYMAFLSQGGIVSGHIRFGDEVRVDNDHVVLPSLPEDHAHTRIICSMRNNPTFLVIWHLGCQNRSGYKEGTLDPFLKAIALRKPLASESKYPDLVPR